MHHTPSYEAFRIGHNVHVFTESGASKSSILKRILGDIKKSRKMCLRFAIVNKLINNNEYKTYKNYFSKTEKERKYCNNLNVLYKDDDEEKVKNDDLNIDDEKFLIINTPGDITINGQRQRVIMEQVSQRKGCCILLNQEFDALRKELNKEENSFDMVLTLLAEENMSG